MRSSIDPELLYGTVVVLLAVLAVTIPQPAETDEPFASDSRVENNGPEVVEVIDGDTVTARIDGELRSVRLAGIDTPEISSWPSTGEWEGVNDGECLRRYGYDARSFLLNRTIGNDVEIFVVGEGVYDRELAFVHENDTNLNRVLVERGLARDYDGRYADLEQEARADERGAWSCA